LVCNLRFTASAIDSLSAPFIIFQPSSSRTTLLQRLLGIRFPILQHYRAKRKDSAGDRNIDVQSKLAAERRIPYRLDRIVGFSSAFRDSAFCAYAEENDVNAKQESESRGCS
jgi:hypothetical protein